MALAIEILWLEDGTKMRLKEYQGKELFKKYKIPVPNSILISKIDNLGEQLKALKYNELIIKAQILSGKRKKAGLIRAATKANAKEVVLSLLNKNINNELIKELLIEERIYPKHEFFLSLAVNRAEKCFSILFSEQGGVDIEELNERFPERVIKETFYEFDEFMLLSLSKAIKNNAIRKIELNSVIKQMFSMLKECDAELVEINPLMLTKDNRLVAADSKIVIDDNALFRHPDFAELKNKGMTETEKKASDYGLHYVDLKGDIAIIGNGAGLVMATLDILNFFGGSAANFLDISGGASVEKMEKALELVLKKDIKGIFINIFGGITRCDDIAQGIVNYTAKNNVRVPIVVRMIGTNEDKAEQILRQNNIRLVDSMEQGLKEIIAKCQS